MCRDCGGGVAKKEQLCLRGVSFVEDFEQYREFSKERQKVAKVRVTFLASISNARWSERCSGGDCREGSLVVRTKYFFLELTCGQVSFWVDNSVCFMSDLLFLVYKLLCSSCNGNFYQSMACY